MWDSLLEIIPEKRLPTALHAATLLSIALPIVAAFSAFVAWKLHDRIGRSTEAGSTPSVAVPAVDDTKQSTEAALRTTQATLQRTEAALQQAREELKQAETRASTAIAHAADRKISLSQRKRFLAASKVRPKGPLGITIIADNAESENYGKLLRSLLVEAGFDVSNEFSEIRLGNESLVGLRVGAFSKETAPPHALPLAASFIDSDIPAFPVVDRRVPSGHVEITVGTNPAAATDDLPPPPTRVAASPTPSGKKSSKTAKGTKLQAPEPELPFPPAKLSLEISPE